MEKIKFGFQVMVLVLALPVWFIAEVKQADKVIEQHRQENIEIIDANKPLAHDAQRQVASNLKLEAMHFSKLMFNNN